MVWNLQRWRIKQPNWRLYTSYIKHWPWI